MVCVGPPTSPRCPRSHSHTLSLSLSLVCLFFSFTLTQSFASTPLFDGRVHRSTINGQVIDNMVLYSLSGFLEVFLFFFFFLSLVVLRSPFPLSPLLICPRPRLFTRVHASLARFAGCCRPINHKSIVTIRAEACAFESRYAQLHRWCVIRPVILLFSSFLLSSSFFVFLFFFFWRV